jgi:hypothetical protein
MLISYALGQESIILRFKITNFSVNWNIGVANIATNTIGLNIATIADNETNGTIYSSAAGTIDTITTIGVYSAPTSGHCNFRQIDPINFLGIYELQLSNARYAVSGAKSLLITIAAITAYSIAQTDLLIPLVQDDPYLAKPTNSNLLAIDTTGRVILQPIGLDSITADGYTARQAIFLCGAGILGEISGLPTSPVTIMGLNGATVRCVMSFDSNSNRLSSIITAP